MGGKFNCSKGKVKLSYFSYTHNIFDSDDSESEGDEMTSRAEEWMGEWATAASDPDGLIRADGKQLTSEIGLTLVNCDTSLNDHDKLTLTQMKMSLTHKLTKILTMATL
jgi:hypothetical protein